VVAGRAGRAACASTAEIAAHLVGCTPSEVTVIGEAMPHEKRGAALPALHASLRDGV